MDAVLREAGSCGRFQVCHVIFTQLPRFVIVWAVFLMMFGSYDPGWRCINNNNNSNKSSLARSDLTFGPISETPSVYGNASADANNGDSAQASPPYSNGTSSGNRTEIKYDGTCDMIDFCDDGIEFNPASLTVLTKFQLVCDRAWIVRCIFIVQGVGFFVGALLGGQIGERFGRRIGLYSSSFIVCLASGLAIFSPHWMMYAVCVFFIGLGCNGVISLSSVFSMEFLSSKWRGYFSSFPTWNVSLLLYTLATLAMKSWMYLHLITFCMALVGSIGFFVVAESPRWLLMNGRAEKAEKAVRKIARINRKPPPNFDTLLQIQADEKEKDEEGGRKMYTYLDLFRTYDVRVATLKLSIVMGFFGVCYYALGFGIQSLPGDFYINCIASSACEIVNLLLTGPLCNHLGRRGAGVFMASLGVLSCGGIVVALFAAEGSTQALIIKLFAFEAKAATQSIFCITQLFIVELLPTVVRNVGIGFCRCAAGLGTLVAPFLIPSAEDTVSFAICFSVMCVVYVIKLVIFLLLPETNKMDLQDGLKPRESKYPLVVENSENDVPKS